LSAAETVPVVSKLVPAIVTGTLPAVGNDEAVIEVIAGAANE